jgi:L-asparaginase/Glu-tRNA(Gln) amidotransferase subunit D
MTGSLKKIATLLILVAWACAVPRDCLSFDQSSVVAAPAIPTPAETPLDLGTVLGKSNRSPTGRSEQCRMLLPFAPRMSEEFRVPQHKMDRRQAMRSLFTLLLGAAIAMPAMSSAQQPTQTLQRVHLITGVGTLPRNPKNRLEFLRYATTGEPRLTGKELLERIPEVQQFARVTVESDELLNFDQPQELKSLSERFSSRLRDSDIAGVVFTHGTNTIEETAYFMNLTVKSEKPVVIVGAQRPFSTLSSDAPLNLLNAIRVAADPASRGKGTLVVLNDEINAARDVTKTNTYRVETFQARELGILGYADSG